MYSTHLHTYILSSLLTIEHYLVHTAHPSISLQPPARRGGEVIYRSSHPQPKRDHHPIVYASTQNLARLIGHDLKGDSSDGVAVSKNWIN